MSQISERRTVHCPSEHASRHLAAFIAEHAANDGAIGIALRVPANVFAGRRILLERRVTATLYPLGAIGDAHQTYSVTLSPRIGGSCPLFGGALAVEMGASDACFGLILNGYYKPQFGTIGMLFDVAFGHRIAKASARDLLQRISRYVENTSAHERAARAAQYRTVAAAAAQIEFSNP